MAGYVALYYNLLLIFECLIVLRLLSCCSFTYLVIEGVGAGTLHIQCDESADDSSQPDVVMVSRNYSAPVILHLFNCQHVSYNAVSCRS